MNTAILVASTRLHRSTDLLGVARAHRATNHLREAAVENGLPSLKSWPHSRARARLLASHTKAARRTLASRNTASLPLVALARSRRAFEGVGPHLVDNWARTEERGPQRQRLNHVTSLINTPSTWYAFLAVLPSVLRSKRSFFRPITTPATCNMYRCAGRLPTRTRDWLPPKVLVSYLTVKGNKQYDINIR